ncbi:MAG TPA: hypothetical protein VNK73_15030 [Actinomycetota bacterium]|nr:hypothetical protein [Actinomycetota bacterium]
MRLTQLAPTPAAPSATVDERPRALTGPARRQRLAPPVLAVVVLLAEAVVLLNFLWQQVSRPFWYDEQWRAWHFSLVGTDFSAQLRDANSPLAAGWVALEKLSIGMLGNTEVPLRLPGVLAFIALGPVTYILSRRFLGVGASFLIAAATLANSGMLTYGLQLKPFTLEALSAELAVLLWFEADKSDARMGERLICYAGIGLCAVFGTAAAFVVGPLLLVDLIRYARGGSLGRLVPSFLAGGITLTHLLGFVLVQTRQSQESPFWNDYFTPGGAFGDKVGFVLHGLGSYVPGMLLGEVAAGHPEITDALAFGPTATGMLVPFLVVGLALGVIAALRSRSGKVLLSVILLALVAQLVAASLRLWPFGFARTNLYLVPFGYLLVGIGVARTVAAVRRLSHRQRELRSWMGAPLVARQLVRRLWNLWLVAPRWLRPLLAPARVRWLLSRSWLHVPAVAVLGLVALVAVANLASVNQVSLRQAELVEQLSRPVPFGGELSLLVHDLRLRETRDDLVVHLSPMTVKGWDYYMRYYQGYGSEVRYPAIPPQRTSLPSNPAHLFRFLNTWPGARDLHVVIQQGQSQEETTAMFKVIRQFGFRESFREASGVTSVINLVRQPPTGLAPNQGAAPSPAPRSPVQRSPVRTTG